MASATEYDVLVRKGGNLAASDLSATQNGYTTPTASLDGVRIPTTSNFKAAGSVSVSVSGGDVTYTGSPDDGAGITTASLTTGGLLDMYTSSPEYAMLRLRGDAETSLGLVHEQNTDIGTDNESFVVGGGSNAYTDDIELHIGGVNGKVLENNPLYGGFATSSTMWMNHLGLWLGGVYGAWGVEPYCTADSLLSIEAVSPRIWNFNPTLYFADFDEGVNYGLTYTIGSGLSFDGDMTADHFIGDGSLLTNLPAGADGVGITTVSLTGGGVVDVTTSAPEYAMISLSSLSPRTDRDTTFTGGLEAAYLYGDGSQLANVVASVVESTTDALTLSEQATTPTTPAAGYAKVWVSAAQDAGGIDGYTVLCLHGDGNDASTNIPDASRNSCSCLAYGNAKISTTQKKFGTASLYFDGAGDYVAVATDGAQDFGCADFTIDCWVWPQTTAATYPSILGSGGAYVPGTFVLYADIKDLPNKYYAGLYGDVLTLGSTSDIVYDAWTHLAIVRYSGVVTLYVNGVAEDSEAYNGYWNLNNQLKIGRYTTSDSNAYKGYVDELRLTKGLARWTANFTPPTKAYGVGPAVHLLDSAGLDTILY